MSLVEQFVRTAKAHERKLAVVDRATGQRVTYRDTLLRSLILSHAFRRYQPGMIGVMIPTSGGAIYSVIAALMSGRTPVMINYSTGAAQNCEMAQRRLAFRTVITSRALLEKIKCPAVDGMVFIEDLAAAVSPLAKLGGFLRASMSADRIVRHVHACREDDHAVILFTSGSEREPKAVPLTHRNIAANIDGHAPGARVRSEGHDPREPAALPRLRAHDHVLAAAHERDDRRHLPQPAGVSRHHHGGPGGGGDDDGGDADVPGRLPAEVGARRLRHRAAADHGRRQVPRVAARRLPRTPRQGAPRRLRHDRDQPGDLRQHARAQPPGQRRQGAAERRRSAWSTTRPASRAA